MPAKERDEAMNWEFKYKTCRSAFLAMSRINSRYKKEQVKEMQRKDQQIKDLWKALRIQEKAFEKFRAERGKE